MTDSDNTEATIQRLFETIANRKGGDPTESYTAKLFDRGTEQIAQKLGEEAVETVIAAVAKLRRREACSTSRSGFAIFLSLLLNLRVPSGV